MKLPLSWVNDYVKIDDIPVKELADKLVNIGFEVEEIINLGEDIENVFTGKIVSVKPHPDADKLLVCEVDFLTEKLSIVTGAKNIKEGDIVPVAKDGARLPGNKVIASSPLRGVLSHGMMCSGKELNIDDTVVAGASMDGILILDKGTPIGRDVKEILGLNECVFDVSVTANRPDCQSVYGMAREISAMLLRKLKPLDLTYKTVEDNSPVFVKIHNYQLCSRYTGRIIKNVKVGTSPDWIARRLRLCGHNAINNIVDITNYVLLEVGQPLHAFDLRNIKNGITVRAAHKDERITALDKAVYTLNESMLVIADDEKALAVAGVMGGEFSGVSADTSDVLLEAARFSRGTVRFTSRALGLRSDSSARYEKGVDWQSVDVGRERALALISQTKAGKVTTVKIEDSLAAPKEKTIITSAEQICSILGIDIKADKIVKILESLSICVEKKDGKLYCCIPLFREDIDNFTDLSEEIIRFYGYDNIHSTVFSPSKMTTGGLNLRQKKIKRIKEFLTAHSAHEIITYSFVNPKQYDRLNLSNAEKNKAISIINPLSEEYSVMRTQLIGSILDIASVNISRKNTAFRLFEIARSYNAKELPLKNLPYENETLTLVFAGENEDFYALKAVICDILDGNKVSYVFNRSEKSWLHPGISADITDDGKIIGSFGKIHPLVAKNFNITQNIYAAEISLEGFLDKEPAYAKYIPLPKFPAVERDLAVTVKTEHNIGELINAIACTAGNLCEGVELFDVYQGEQIEKGYKSVAFSIKLRSSEKTLTEQEILNCINGIINELEKVFGAKLRI